jgi:lysophospholipase
MVLSILFKSILDGRFLTIFIGIFFSFACCLCLPNSVAFALAESTLEHEYPILVEPMLNQSVKGTFQGINALTLVFATFETTAKIPKGHIVLVPGYSESYLKYSEVIYDLTHAGFNVYTYDHRGMGLSPRLTKDPQIVHVKKFADYTQDLQTFVMQVVLPKRKADKAPVFLLAHSMGGLVAAQALAKDSQTFAKAVLVAPLFDMQTGSIPEIVAYLAVTFNDWRGAGEAYAPGFGPFDAEAATVNTSKWTQSAARFAVVKKLWLDTPKTLMSGPSNNWVRTTLAATWDRNEIANKIKTPVLLFQATQDYYADPEGQNSFCSSTKYCKCEVVANSYHDIFMEKDTVRRQVLEKIITFFAAP